MIRTVLASLAACLTLGISAAQADYWGRWDRVGGGWTTGWIRHSGNANVCGHGAAGCSCFGRNYCGTYRNGAVTTWWPYGCGNPTIWQVRCTIQPIADSGAAECGSYSATAVQQHGENVRRRCGYTGGRWHSNYQAHYNWCVHVSPAARAGETQARQNGLAQCDGFRGDVLGTVWDEEEVAGWRSTWVRRGSSNVFDASLVHPDGRRERAVLTIVVSDRSVTVHRQQIAPSYPGMRCTYHGTIGADGRSVTGTYGCTWAQGPFNWRATIR